MIIPLSYPLTSESPLYPGTPEPVIFSEKDIARGDTATTSTFTVHSHSGTHIDAPRHFYRDGASLTCMIAYGEIIGPAYCLSVPLTGDACLLPRDICRVAEGCNDAAALLVRTGAYRDREASPERYRREHPWVHPGVPDALRSLCPHLRLFGIDTISVATPLHREEGRACHRAFLCERSPVLLLEDVNLGDDRLLSGVWRIHLYPFLYEPLDGVPVFACAEMIA
ncbi:MAG: hypothetical protein APR53_03250 [Methanoculleus sp. SDB]|nr:MAG: hypothetical protein APR53_03250 [Methanoculleus sp. SDB]